MYSELLSTLSAVLIHELGHIIAMLLLGVTPKRGKLGVWGIRIDVDYFGVSYLKQIIISLSGSAANLLTALFCVGSLRSASMAYGMFNLIPITALDGGAVLEVLMSLCSVCYEKIIRVQKLFDLGFVVILWICAVYCALKFGAAGLLFSSLYLLGACFVSQRVD